MHLVTKINFPASDHLLIEKEAAFFLGTSQRTLQRWRLTGEGPIYRRLGKRRVVYCRADLLAWIGGRAHSSTSEEGYRRSRAA